MAETGPGIQDLPRHALLTSDEERALLRLAKSGDLAARNHLILANLRLIAKIARPYTSRSYPMEDAIGDGVIGLDHAIEKFDLTLPHRFSTYAYWWIRHSIQKASAAASQHVNVPTQAIIHIQKLKHVYRAYLSELGREPSIEEMATDTGLAASRVLTLFHLLFDPVSLDAPCHDGGDTLGEMQMAPEVAHGPRTAHLRATLDSMIERLPAGQQRVLTLRFGLDGTGARSYREVAQETGWSRETIKRYERKAIHTLRAEFQVTVMDLSHD